MEERGKKKKDKMVKEAVQNSDGRQELEEGKKEREQLEENR